MPVAYTTGTLVVLIFFMNVPFGFWRGGLARFSFRWFVAVHAPVVLGIGMRIVAGLGWRLSTLPLFVSAFFAGQLLGGRLRSPRKSR